MAAAANLSAATPSAERTAVTPLNRRVSIRYPCEPLVGTELALDKSYLFRRVRVVNISTGGIALLLKYPPQRGMEVYVRLTNSLLSFTYDLSAVTMHASRQDDGKWLVGFAFIRELTFAELASLI
jgi:hypothetical protein